MCSLEEIKKNLINDYERITSKKIIDGELNSLLSKLYMDSLQFVELLIATEERYDFEFEDEMYFKDAFSSLAKIAEYSFIKQNS